MTMVTISRDDMVILPGQRNGADGNRFLPVVKMKEAPHLTRSVLLKRGLLEPANSYDVSKNADLPFRTQLLIDGSGGVVDGGVHVAG